MSVQIVQIADESEERPKGIDENLVVGERTQLCGRPCHAVALPATVPTNIGIVESYECLSTTQTYYLSTALH